MKAEPQPEGKVARLLAVLKAKGPGVHLNCRDLGKAADVAAKDVSPLMRHQVAVGRVVLGGKSRRHTYALADVPEGARLCHCCGQHRDGAGGKLVRGTGWCCAECVDELGPAPKRGERSPEGRPPAESPEPWRPHRVTPPPAPPAQAAGLADLPPGVKVTVRPTPRGRFEVDPAAVPLVFSALRPGQYLEADQA